jgi:peptidoglycan-associated lipoprotein
MISAKTTAFALAGALALMLGCGPKYPNCDTDEHCKEQNEFCVNGMCKQCRDDSQCNSADACGACLGNACGRRAGCCTSDADCPPPGRCWNVPGKAYGQCGAQCGAGKACPPGQRCNAQGECEPDVECSAANPCPPGQTCKNGSCVAGCNPQVVYFDFNESRIRLDQQSTMNANADCIKNRGQSVRIKGHCDERGTEEYNMALGERRCNSSKRYLKNLGVSGGSLSITSYGEEQPTCSSSNEGCWSQNRRAEFTFE